MDVQDAIMVAVKEVPSGLATRTAIQKILYFAKRKKIIASHYRAHYYGPYSKEISIKLQSLQSMGFIHETPQLLSPEARAYISQPTPDGKLLFEHIMQQNQDDIHQLKEIIDVCSKVNISVKTLSAAAKIDFILQQSAVGKMSIDEVKREAGKLGWNLSGDGINKTVDLLEALGLAKRS